MALDPKPRRALTSREIASALGALAGAWAMETPPEEVMAAFEHFVEHKQEYIEAWVSMKMNSAFQQHLQ